MAERLEDSGILRTRARPRAASKSDSEWMISKRRYNLLSSTEVSRNFISSQMKFLKTIVSIYVCNGTFLFQAWLKRAKRITGPGSSKDG